MKKLHPSRQQGLSLGQLRKIHSQTGGAAIEYIIVSTFATILAIAAITFVTTTIKDKLTSLEDKIGISFDDESLNVFGGP